MKTRRVEKVEKKVNKFGKKGEKVGTREKRGGKKG